MIRVAVVSAAVFLAASHASALTCEDILWGKDNLSQAQQDALIARASPEQIAFGEACLRRAGIKIPRHRIVQRKRQGS